MAAIILPRKHYTQPQGRVELAPEWENGLIAAFLPSSMSPEWTINGTTGLFVPRRDGIAFDTNGGSTYAHQTVAEHQNTGFTMLASGVTKSNASKDYAGVYNGGTYQGLLYSTGSSKFSYFPRNGLAVVFDSPTLTSFGGNEYTVIGGGNGAVHHGALMQDGAFFSAGGSYTNTSAYNSIYSGSRFSTVGQVSNTLTAFWRKLLTAEAMYDLALNPWQIFRADPVRIYSLPPILTIPTLSSPGVIDITAASARPQVTLAY